MFNHKNKKKEFIESNEDTQLFSTQVSSFSQIDNQSIAEPKNIFRISSKFIDQPSIYLKKLKSQTKDLHQQMRYEKKNYLKIKNSLQNKYRQISLSRYDFLKLYSVKKCKNEIKQLKDDHKNQQELFYKQNIYRAKKQRYGQQISIIIRKEETQRMKEELKDKHNEERKALKEEIMENHLRFTQTLFDKIKKRKIKRQIGSGALRRLSPFQVEL